MSEMRRALHIFRPEDDPLPPPSLRVQFDIVADAPVTIHVDPPSSFTITAGGLCVRVIHRLVPSDPSGVAAAMSAYPTDWAAG